MSMRERQRSRRNGVHRGLTTASATARVFPIQETVRVRRGSRDVFMNERARAQSFGSAVRRRGHGTSLDSPTGRATGERGYAGKPVMGGGETGSAAVDGAHLVLVEPRLRPHPARSTNYPATSVHNDRPPLAVATRTGCPATGSSMSGSGYRYKQRLPQTPSRANYRLRAQKTPTRVP